VFLPNIISLTHSCNSGVAKPSLLSPIFFQRNVLNITDEDPLEYTAFMDLSGPGKTYSAASWFCAWHKGNRNLHKPLIGAIKTMSAVAKNEFKVVEEWLYSFTNKVESETEYEQSKALLLVFLEEECRELSSPVIEHIKDYVATKFHPKIAHLGHFNFMHFRSLGWRTSSNVEAENSVTKTSSTGPKAQHPIDVSSRALVRNQFLRNKRKGLVDAAALDKTRVRPDDRLSTITGNCSPFCHPVLGIQDFCISPTSFLFSFRFDRFCQQQDYQSV